LQGLFLVQFWFLACFWFPNLPDGW
jgi:hypothetical protein